VDNRQVPSLNFSVESVRASQLFNTLYKIQEKNYTGESIAHKEYRVALSVQCMTIYQTTGVRSPTEAEYFSSASTSRLALGPTQPPVQWVPGALYPGVKCGQGMTLTTHPHLMPRLGMSRSYTSYPSRHFPGGKARSGVM
jgi:hypothetical protein